MSTFVHPPTGLVPRAAVVALALAIGMAAPAAPAQERPDSTMVEEASVRVGPGTAELSAEFADGSRRSVALSDGDVLVDGESRASYEVGGELEEAWRDFLRETVDPTARDLASSVRAWSPPAGVDTGAAAALEEALAPLRAAAPAQEAERGPGPDATAAPAKGDTTPADTVELMDEETRVAPSGPPVEELRERLDDFRDAVDRIGRGAVDALRDAALVVHDDYEIEAGRSVEGAVALLSGELRLGGQVDGDVLVLDGNLVLESGSSVSGDVLQVGGTVTNRGGSIAGELVSVGGREAFARDVEPDEDFGDRLEARIEERLEEEFGRDRRRRAERGFGHTVWDNVTDGLGALFTTFSFFLVLAVLGAIPLYFARSKFETVSDTVRHSFGRSFLLGLAAQVLFLPALVVLAVGILTIPLIPVFVFGAALASVLGYLAVAHSMGEVIEAREYGWLRDAGDGRYRTLFVGIAALLSLFVVLSLLQFIEGIAEPLFVLTLLGAITVTWVAFTAGFGAVALSYAGTRDDYAGPGAPGGGGPGGRPSERRGPPVPAPGEGAGESRPPSPEEGGAPTSEAPEGPGPGEPPADESPPEADAPSGEPGRGSPESEPGEDEREDRRE